MHFYVQSTHVFCPILLGFLRGIGDGELNCGKLQVSYRQSANQFHLFAGFDVTDHL